MSKLKIFNTETRKKENFEKISEKVLIYTCGPTIYDFAHIGNFRTYVFEDLLRRVLKFAFGEKNILQAMNITDVDDKTIKGAKDTNKTLKEYTEPFKKAFFEDVKTLNIEPVEFYPEATDYIDEMIKIIQKLLDQKIAYVGHDKSIYFSIAKFPTYGRLSHLDLKSLKKGASERIIEDEYEKDNFQDFVLWKFYDEKRDGKIYWDGPFGKGRPGWHIECSAMAIKLLGETIDIHCGGVDNIFPHHENEIAQSESFTKKKFVRYWMHSEHLLVNNKKMSKSLGHFYTLRDLLKKGYSGEEIRYLLIQTHYRHQLNFTMEGLDAARKSLLRISDFIKRISSIENFSKNDEKEIDEIIKLAENNFFNSLLDDLNISKALASIFDLIRDVNSFADKNLLTKDQTQNVLKLFVKFNEILACLPLEQKDVKISKDLENLLEKRKQARDGRNFKLADSIRDEISALGYVIEDTSDGAKLKKK